MTPTSFQWIVPKADPLGAAFAVQSQEFFFLLVVDADQISTSRETVFKCPFPAFPQGWVHIVEELQQIIYDEPLI